jgi:CRP-like cAMP-binding protein
MALLQRKSDKVDVLAAVPLFAGLSRKELGDITRLVTEVEFSPREYLTHEGETGREAMVLLAGRATVRRNGRKIAVMEAGDVVGEMSLITERPRSASIRADTFVTALVMNSREFHTLIDDHPQVGVKILRTVARRLVDSV